MDYALQRRSLLSEVDAGRTAVGAVCDADRYLLRAAAFHGRPSDVICPICRKEQLTLVSWVFGDRLGTVNGSAGPPTRSHGSPRTARSSPSTSWRCAGAVAGTIWSSRSSQDGCPDRGSDVRVAPRAVQTGPRASGPTTRTVWVNGEQRNWCARDAGQEAVAAERGGVDRRPAGLPGPARGGRDGRGVPVHLPRRLGAGPDAIKQNQVATILDSRGGEIARIVPPEGNRTDVSINQIPKAMQDAVIAAEDREFRTNAGFSVSGLARAALGQLTNNADAGGGSTITQQYVKNASSATSAATPASSRNSRSRRRCRTSGPRTNHGRLPEHDLLRSWRVRRLRSAKAYFDKDISQITVPEAAVLASSIRSPSYYDPATNPRRRTGTLALRARRHGHHRCAHAPGRCLPEVPAGRCAA